MSVNAVRGHLSEFGIIAAKGIGRVDELLDLVESDTTLPNAIAGLSTPAISCCACLLGDCKSSCAAFGPATTFHTPARRIR